jgi:hypothetical protein
MICLCDVRGVHVTWCEYRALTKHSSLHSSDRRLKGRRVSISAIGRRHLQWTRELGVWFTHHDAEKVGAERALRLPQVVQGAEALALAERRVVLQCSSEVS